MDRAPGRPLRALIFDAGNTLLRMDYGAIAAALGAQGHPATAAAVEAAEVGARVRLDPHLGAPGASTETGPTHDRYLRYLLEPLGVTDPAEVRALERWRGGYNPPAGLWHRAHPEAAPALARARAAGLVTGVISNSNGSVRATLQAAGLGAGLDFVIDSAEVGVEKPDSAIFRLALAAAGVGAAEAAYVGDLYSVDVLGARRAGLLGILLDPAGAWGPRDCPRVPSLDAAVALALG